MSDLSISSVADIEKANNQIALRKFVAESPFALHTIEDLYPENKNVEAITRNHARLVSDLIRTATHLLSQRFSEVSEKSWINGTQPGFLKSVWHSIFESKDTLRSARAWAAWNVASFQTIGILNKLADQLERQLYLIDSQGGSKSTALEPDTKNKLTEHISLVKQGVVESFQALDSLETSLQKNPNSFSMPNFSTLKDLNERLRSQTASIAVLTCQKALGA